MSYQEYSFDREDIYYSKIIHILSDTLKRALQNHERVILAVSGGRSPIGLFKKLSVLDLEWCKVIITLVDERCMDCDSEQSNQNLVKTYLHKNKAEAARFLPLYDDQADIWGADLTVKNAFFQNHMDQFPLITILGMGEDGHIASLFPASDTLEHGLTTQTPLSWQTAPIFPEKRLSLSMRAILASNLIILPLSGQRKIDTYQKAKQKNAPYPISHILHHARNLQIYLLKD